MTPRTFILLMGLFLALPCLAEEAETPRNFTSWKKQKIQEAQRAYFDLDKKLEASAKNGLKMTETDRTTLLSQARNNIQVATALSRQDYFNLHVKKIAADREKFVKLIKILSPEELADLFLEYQKNIDKMEQDLGTKAPVPGSENRNGLKSMKSTPTAEMLEKIELTVSARYDSSYFSCAFGCESAFDQFYLHFYFRIQASGFGALHSIPKIV